MLPVLMAHSNDEPTKLRAKILSFRMRHSTAKRQRQWDSSNPVRSSIDYYNSTTVTLKVLSLTDLCASI